MNFILLPYLSISFVLYRDVISCEDEDEDELDSRNCTIDDDTNESLIIHPRVVLPQSSTRKRLLNQDDDTNISPSKRLCYEGSREMVTKTFFFISFTFYYDILVFRVSLHHNVSLLKPHFNVSQHWRTPHNHLQFQQISK